MGPSQEDSSNSKFPKSVPLTSSAQQGFAHRHSLLFVDFQAEYTPALRRVNMKARRVQKLLHYPLQLKTNGGNHA